MKKLMIAVTLVLATVTAKADFDWNWWVGGNKTMRGCQMGIASEAKEVKGAQVSLLWGRVDKMVGCQFAFGYTNCRKTLNGPQIATVNIAREGAALQFGLLNFNKTGFLPFFPFFNFSTKCFGSADK